MDSRTVTVTKLTSIQSTNLVMETGDTLPVGKVSSTTTGGIAVAKMNGVEGVPHRTNATRNRIPVLSEELQTC